MLETIFTGTWRYNMKSILVMLFLLTGCASKHINKETDVSADAFFCFICGYVDTDVENNLEYDKEER